MAKKKPETEAVWELVRTYEDGPRVKWDCTVVDVNKALADGAKVIVLDLKHKVSCPENNGTVEVACKGGIGIATLKRGFVTKVEAKPAKAAKPSKETKPKALMSAVHDLFEQYGSEAVSEMVEYLKEIETIEQRTTGNDQPT